MPFINANIKDAQEDKVVPEGNYDLVITSVQEKDSKNGEPMLACLIKIEGEEGQSAKPIFHYIMLPSDKGAEPDAKYPNTRRLRDMRRFLEVFEVPWDESGFDTDDLQGARGNCLVKISPAEGDYEESNQIALPKFKDEPQEQPARKAAAGGSRRRR